VPLAARRGGTRRGIVLSGCRPRRLGRRARAWSAVRGQLSVHRAALSWAGANSTGPPSASAGSCAGLSHASRVERGPWWAAWCWCPGAWPPAGTALRALGVLARARRAARGRGAACRPAWPSAGGARPGGWRASLGHRGQARLRARWPGKRTVVEELPVLIAAAWDEEVPAAARCGPRLARARARRAAGAWP
jgi:hypothetical protein